MRDSKGRFIKGQASWNKGIPQSEKAKEKNRKAHLGKKHSEETKEKLRGKPPWNKGKKGLHAGWNKGLKGVSKGAHPKEKHHNWKGKDAGYSALHKWAARHFENSDTCEHCNISGLSGAEINWASTPKENKRNREAWLRLCVPCHRKYDLADPA